MDKISEISYDNDLDKKEKPHSFALSNLKIPKNRLILYFGLFLVIFFFLVLTISKKLLNTDRLAFVKNQSAKTPETFLVGPAGKYSLNLGAVDAYSSYLLPDGTTYKAYIYKGDRVWHYICQNITSNPTCTAQYTRKLADYFKSINNQQVYGDPAKFGLPKENLDAVQQYLLPDGTLKQYIYKGDRVWHYICQNITSNPICTAQYTWTLDKFFQSIAKQGENWSTDYNLKILRPVENAELVADERTKYTVSWKKSDNIKKVKVFFQTKRDGQYKDYEPPKTFDTQTSTQYKLMQTYGYAKEGRVLIQGFDTNNTKVKQEIRAFKIVPFGLYTFALRWPQANTEYLCDGNTKYKIAWESKGVKTLKAFLQYKDKENKFQKGETFTKTIADVDSETDNEISFTLPPKYGDFQEGRILVYAYNSKGIQILPISYNIPIRFKKGVFSLKLLIPQPSQLQLTTGTPYAIAWNKTNNIKTVRVFIQYLKDGKYLNIIEPKLTDKLLINFTIPKKDYGPQNKGRIVLYGYWSDSASNDSRVASDSNDFTIIPSEEVIEVTLAPSPTPRRTPTPTELLVEEPEGI